MAFKYYYEYLNPEGAPEMPENKQGDEIISGINHSEREARSGFVNLAVLTVTLVFCALCVFVLRENDYSRFDEALKPTKENIKSGEFTAELEGDVLSHLTLEEKIIRADNFLNYFTGVGNELMKAEKSEDPEVVIGGAFRQQSVLGGSGAPSEGEDVTHVVETRLTDEQKHTEGTKKPKKTEEKKEEETETSTGMTSREDYAKTTTEETTTTPEPTTTTVKTNNDAPDVTTKVTTASTTTKATTTTKAATTTKKTTTTTTTPTDSTPATKTVTKCCCIK